MLRSPELERIRSEYADREDRLAEKELYSRNNPAHRFMLQSRKRAVLKILQDAGFSTLEKLNILEVGCGRGGVLQEVLSNGANIECLHGTDLLLNRLKDAQEAIPQIPFTCANGEDLPYASNCFDLVLQFTVFSSILDKPMKTHIANEMLRVLRKPQGAILWYDFWLNPINKQAQGIRPGEIRSLFPGCRFSFRRITLAPPIARRIVPFSWKLASVLEKLKVFNSHYLVLVRPIG
jgi:ubiquinone/menaquinone biosynthesis C-methylase UbiE